MATRAREQQLRHQHRLRQEAERRRAERARALKLHVLGALALAVMVLGGVFLLSNGSGTGGGKTGGEGTGTASKYAFTVGYPGPGQPAPPITPPATRGGTFELASKHGTTVLLFFQEGLTCQPCWDQLKDIERQAGRFRALGIDEIVSVTTNPLEALRQKVGDEGISSPVLSDANARVSSLYGANHYGMMGTGRDGHSFVVVGPDGRIRWRADYGGPPNYTMYLPVDSLVADLRKGLRAGGRR